MAHVLNVSIHMYFMQALVDGVCESCYHRNRWCTGSGANLCQPHPCCRVSNRNFIGAVE